MIAHKIPDDFGQKFNNYTAGDIVNVAVAIFSGGRNSAKFEHYELYYHCEIIADSYDVNGKHWFKFKNQDMTKPKKMQGKNFYDNARLVSAASDKEQLTNIKNLSKQNIATIIGEKKF